MTKRNGKTGQSGPAIDLDPGDLNADEYVIVAMLALYDSLSIRELAAACFKSEDAKAKSRVRNALRRPVRGGWVAHNTEIGDGTYRVTAVGRLGCSRATKAAASEAREEPPAPPPRAKTPSAASDSLQIRFETYHRENPDVYQHLIRLARAAIARGRQRVGIGMLFEVLRWERFLETNDPEGWKLNNSYRSRYARLMMEREAGMETLFETRELKSS